MNLLISFVPVIVMIVMLAGFKVRGDITGIIGWILTIIVAVVFFNSDLVFTLLASFKGLLASMAITGMGFFALLQIVFMQETGALQRIVIWIKTFSHDDKPCQIMVINVILGSMLVCVGATPAIILPPIMFAMGYTTVLAIALPCIGYDSLCTFAMLGAAVVSLYNILVGLSPDQMALVGWDTAPTLQQCAIYFANYLPIITPCICFAMLIMAGGVKLLKEGWLAALITGLCMGGFAFLFAHFVEQSIVLMGVLCGACSLVVMLLYMKIRGVQFFNRTELTEEDLALEKEIPLWKALTPWGLLIFFCVITNFIAPLKDFLWSDPAMKMNVVLFPGDSGQPMRVIWNAYFWVFVSTLLSAIVLKPRNGSSWGTILKKWNHRWAPPTISSIVYFMIAYVMMYSGYVFGVNEALPATNTFAGQEIWYLPPQTDAATDTNIVALWAHSAADAFGWWYPVANGFLGLLGGFITGSEASTVAFFAQYNIISSGELGFNALAVIASAGIAAGLASVVTPVKLQQSAASLDKIGSESQVLRKVLPYAVILVTVSVVMSQIFAITIPA